MAPRVDCQGAGKNFEMLGCWVLLFALPVAFCSQTFEIQHSASAQPRLPYASAESFLSMQQDGKSIHTNSFHVAIVQQGTNYEQGTEVVFRCTFGRSEYALVMEHWLTLLFDQPGSKLSQPTIALCAKVDKSQFDLWIYAKRPLSPEVKMAYLSELEAVCSATEAAAACLKEERAKMIDSVVIRMIDSVTAKRVDAEPAKRVDSEAAKKSTSVAAKRSAFAVAKRSDSAAVKEPSRLGLGQHIGSSDIVPLQDILEEPPFEPDFGQGLLLFSSQCADEPLSIAQTWNEFEMQTEEALTVINKDHTTAVNFFFLGKKPGATFTELRIFDTSTAGNMAEMLAKFKAMVQAPFAVRP